MMPMSSPDNVSALPRQEERIRRKQNAWVRERYFAGDSLSAVPAAATHFPNRQAVPKDVGALDLLFGGVANLPLDAQGEKGKILLFPSERSSDG